MTMLAGDGVGPELMRHVREVFRSVPTSTYHIVALFGARAYRPLLEYRLTEVNFYM